MASILSVLIIILIIRWIVWRNRLSNLRDQIKSLQARINNLEKTSGVVNESQESTPNSDEKPPWPIPVAFAKTSTPPSVSDQPKSEPGIVTPTITTKTSEPKPVPEEPQPEPGRGVALSRGYKEMVDEALARSRLELTAASSDSGGSGQTEPVSTTLSKEKDAWIEPATTESSKLFSTLGASLKNEAAAWKTEGLSWEAVIGTRWLDKIGIIILTIGMVLFLGYSLQYFGPLGKVATGFLTGFGLIIGGVFLEKTERYKLLSKPLLGGGWAVSYFTAFAAHNLPPSKIIDDPIWALLLLVLIAAGIIAHTFRYRSQVVTSLAYGLGFLAVSISPMTSFSLITTAILAASLIGTLRLLPWYHLALVGMAGTYINHLIWMGGGIQFLIEPGIPIGYIDQVPIDYMDQLGGSSDPFWLTQGILIFYWLIFTLSAFIRTPGNQTEQQISILISVANSAGFLAISAWQLLEISPDDIHILTSASAIAYIAIAYLLKRVHSQLLHLINGSIACVLLAISIPLAIHSWNWYFDWMALAWVVEAAGLFYIGYRLKEIVYRVEAYLLSAAGFLAILIFNLQGSPVDRYATIAITLIPAILFFYYLQEIIQSSSKTDSVLTESWELGVGFGYLGATVLAGLIWQEIKPDFVALAWLITGLALFEAGAKTSRIHIRFQGYLFTLLAVGALFLINFQYFLTPPIAIGHSLWISVSPTVPLIYLLYWRLLHSVPIKKPNQNEISSAMALMYAATTILVPLFYKQIPLEWIGLIFVGMGMLFFEIGLRLREFHIRVQGYILLMIAVAELFYVNIYAVSQVPDMDLPSRWVIVLPAALAFYLLFWRAYAKPARSVFNSTEGSFLDIPSYIATALFTTLLWKELGVLVVVLGWGFYGLLLFEAGSKFNNRALKVQGHFLEALAIGRVFMFNFAAYEEIMGISQRLIGIVPIVSILYYLRARVSDAENNEFYFDWIQPAYSYSAAIILVVLFNYEFGRAYTVIGWSVLMLALLLLGHRSNDRDFRFQSYILAILIFVRSWATNLILDGSTFGIPDRFLTTIPAIGALLTAALFCHWKEKARKDQLPAEWPVRIKQAIKSAPVLYSVLAPALTSIFLFYEVPANFLTLAWGVEALVVLALGFLLPERVFRWYGLGLLLVCVIKLFALDLADVETFYRILSFIVLGVILLAISFAYTRYRDIFKRCL